MATSKAQQWADKWSLAFGCRETLPQDSRQDSRETDIERGEQLHMSFEDWSALSALSALSMQYYHTNGVPHEPESEHAVRAVPLSEAVAG